MRKYIPEDLQDKLHEAYCIHGANQYTFEEVLNKWFKNKLQKSQHKRIRS